MYGSSEIFPYNIGETNSLQERIKSVPGMVLIIIGAVSGSISIWIFFHSKILGCSLNKKIVRVSAENVTERKLDKEIINISSHGLDSYDIFKNPEYKDIIKSINAAANKSKGTGLTQTSISLVKPS
jgi:precorrin-6B methylase 2